MDGAGGGLLILIRWDHFKGLWIEEGEEEISS